MSGATPEDLANGIKLLERLRTGELNLIPAFGIPSKQDASTAMLQRVEDVLRAAFKRVVEPIGDGGPVHPQYDFNPHSGQQYCCDPGMSLRDHFAGLAFPAVIGSLHGPVVCEEAKGDFDRYAEAAYAMADAMLKARQS